MNVSNRKWVDDGGSVLQWYASGVSDGTRIQRNWLTWIVHGHVLLYMGRRGEAGWEKTWSEKHPAVTFGTPCPLMSVIRTSIIWLPLFHRSLVISLHVGTSSVVLSPRGCSDYGWLDSRGVVPKYVASRGRELNMTASAYPKNKSGIAKHYDTPILLRACNTRKNSKLPNLVFASIYPAWKKDVVQKNVVSRGSTHPH